MSRTAEHLKVTRSALSHVLNSKAIFSLGMAIRFEKAFGIQAATVLRMQGTHDLGQVKQEAAPFGVTRLPESGF